MTWVCALKVNRAIHCSFLRSCARYRSTTRTGLLPFLYPLCILIVAATTFYFCLPTSLQSPAALLVSPIAPSFSPIALFISRQPNH